jgi:galactokinase
MTTPLSDRTLAAFRAAFGGEPSCVVQAPGRVNLIGEHTDYNDGFVLPCAIDFGTQVAGRARDDTTVRIIAADCGHAIDSFRLDRPITPLVEAPWANYARGMVRMLLEHGLALGGADLAVAGDVPQGAGLSSSASFEVAVGQAFKSLRGLDTLTPTALARLAQRAENEFVGCDCGIMDQLICTSGLAGHALLIDCRSLDARAIALPEDLAVMIVHSRVQRGLVDSEYNIRRRQCEAAAHHHGVRALRDLDLAALQAGSAGLDQAVLQRARHVVSENERTLQAADALAAGELSRLGPLMAASHASMRDDFEITVPAIDRLVEIMQTAIGDQGGARMTGGGFGGCCVGLLPRSRTQAVREAIDAQYRAPNGERASVFVCSASAGAAEL